MAKVVLWHSSSGAADAVTAGEGDNPLTLRAGV